MDKLKQLDGGVVIAGDGRHDSMGTVPNFVLIPSFAAQAP